MTQSVSIQQAGANAFAAWLQTKMPDCVVEPRWPGPDKDLPAKAITLVLAGQRRDTPIDARPLSYTNNGSLQTDAVWQVDACEQPLQLDVWATNDIDRDDIVSRLDTFLHWGERELNTNADPFGTSVLLPVFDGWDAIDTIADFHFDSPDVDDSNSSVTRSSYRASYRGTGYFMLTVNSTTARIKVNQMLLTLT